MIRFHIILSLVFLLVATTTTSTSRLTAVPPAAFSGQMEQLFVPSTTLSPAATDQLQSEKRRVPTGSNPLHNKRKV
ncbi:hypothetical protein HanIR_Chr10g0486391 [Helianthus annuus]|nr:hypothetical protein HanIR_Chr10g0486391 [Helianthus annuus]